MCDGSGATAGSHDAMHRPLQERRTIGTVKGDYDTVVYNLDGSVASNTALGYVTTYTYSAAARPITAAHSTTKFVGGVTYAPQGAISSGIFGAATGFTGITVMDTYNKRLQPSTITASLPSNALVQSLTYNFNLNTSDNGNVYSITNGKDATRSETFTYDKLNRITTAKTQGTSGPNCWGQRFGHLSGSTFVPGIDPWGNLVEITNTQAGCVSFTLSQAVTTKNQFASMVYDAAGNLTNDGAHPYTYDAENRLLTAGGATYTYDGDGKRVKKSSGTLYWTGPGWDPLVETDLSGTVTENYIFFNGERVARVDMPAGTVEYYFSDHLKSTDIVTNATGGILRESDYVPYGSEVTISGTDPNHYKFTGKERDLESGLDDFDARFYSSPFGRFMTPDWEAKPTDVPYANFGNPQSLNLYSYVQNNPTTVGDADGHSPDAGVVETVVLVSTGVVFTAAVIQNYRQNPDAGKALRGATEAAHQFLTTTADKLSSIFSSRDAEARQLQGAGRDATDKANATIERASQDLGSYKNPNDVSAHIDDLKKGVDRVKGLSTQLDRTTGKAQRDNIKSELKRETDQVKGHEKDLRQKPKKQKPS